MSYLQSTSLENLGQVEQNTFVHRVYGWMTGGLAITAVIALAVAASPDATMAMRGLFIPLIVIELLLVFGLSFLVNRIPPALAAVMFLGYSALNGLTLSAIFLVYTSSSIASAFVVSAGMFGAMAVYGSVTKRDLTSVGSFMVMGLIGIILASVVNIWLHSPMIYWVTTYLGVFIFVGLTAYDAQKIKQIGAAGWVGDASRRASIMGALALYLDFINLFLMVLRIFGGGRRD